MTTGDITWLPGSRTCWTMFVWFPVCGAVCAAVLSILRITGLAPDACDWGMIAVVSIALATAPLVLYGGICALLGGLLLIILAVVKIVGGEISEKPQVTERERRQLRVCSTHLIWAYVMPGNVIVIGSLLAAWAAVRYMRPDLDPNTWSCWWRSLLLFIPTALVLARPLAMFSDYTMPKRHREVWKRLRRRHL